MPLSTHQQLASIHAKEIGQNSRSFINCFKREGNPHSISAAMFREVFGSQYHCFGPLLAHGLLSEDRRITGCRVDLLLMIWHYVTRWLTESYSTVQVSFA